MGRREIAKAFGVKGEGRVPLKGLLRDMCEEGLLQKGRGKSYVLAGGLPSVCLLTVQEVDEDGDLRCRPAERRLQSSPAEIRLLSRRPRDKQLLAKISVGERVLARLEKTGDTTYDARPIKIISSREDRFVGVYTTARRGPDRIRPLDRNARTDFSCEPDQAQTPSSGDLVIAEPTAGGKTARVIEVIGRSDDPKAISLIAIHKHNLPYAFSQEVEQEALSRKRPRKDKREDFTDLPFVTIDPDDAKDFDDAIHAEPDPAADNAGGWRVIVAIADVAHYVRPDSLLDANAYDRGNSCYFPDRVVPMLPEHLSNDMCSLRPDEIRPAMAVRMVFDKNGRKLRHRFHRVLIKSQGRLTYREAQAAFDGQETSLSPVLENILSAYRALAKARNKRAPLDLDLDEHKIIFHEDGRVSGVTTYERYDAHKLIEEFMIQANVCAAETIENHNFPCLYRIHDAPSDEKLAGFNEFLQTMGLSLAKAQVLKPQAFNRILEEAKKEDAVAMISDVVLRTQSQAEYSTRSIGHFGLNLRRYAHFTSPIRRYADLIVHRTLIRLLNLGPDGLTDAETQRLDEIATHISKRERETMAAERETVDRYIASYLEDRTGATFDAKISGVTRFGLFVKLKETGADGFVPMRSLHDDWYELDEVRKSLVGRDKKGIYQLGQDASVRLVEATPLQGGLRFEILSEPRNDTEPRQDRRPTPPKGRGKRTTPKHKKRQKMRRQ